MKRACSLSFLALVTLLAGCSHSSAATAPPYLRAEIHCVSWDITTAVAMSIDAVREAPLSVVTDPAELAAVVKTLRLDQLPPKGTKAAALGAREALLGDFRVAIDLVRSDEKKEGFGSDRFRLVRLSDGAWAPIDEAFRKRFACH